MLRRGILCVQLPPSQPARPCNFRVQDLPPPPWYCPDKDPKNSSKNQTEHAPKPAVATSSRPSAPVHQHSSGSVGNAQSGPPNNRPSSSLIGFVKRQLVVSISGRKRWTCIRTFGGKPCAKSRVNRSVEWDVLMQHNVEVHGDEWGCLYCGIFVPYGEAWKTHMQSRHKGALGRRESSKPRPHMTRSNVAARQSTQGPAFKEELSYGRKR